MFRLKSIPVMAALIALWCGGIAAGGWAMLTYELTPGATVAGADCWPTDTQLAHAESRPTLLMFVHPQCPCSRASIAELTQLAVTAGTRLDVQIVFTRPAGVDESWDHTSLRAAAEKIQDAQLITDFDGVETACFGATTSGEAFLYDSQGRLLFHGGITPARGHEGNSCGREAILALLNHETAASSSAQVFGCPLCNSPCCEEPNACSR